MKLRIQAICILNDRGISHGVLTDRHYIFPILWVQYKIGRKCVKRHPLFRLIICTLVKIHCKREERKKPGLYSTDVRKRFQSVDHIGNIYGIITVSVHLICKPTHPAYWSNKVNVQNERVLNTQTEEKKHCVEDESGKMIFQASAIQRGCSLLIYMWN